MSDTKPSVRWRHQDRCHLAGSPSNSVNRSARWGHKEVLAGLETSTVVGPYLDQSHPGAVLALCCRGKGVKRLSLLYCCRLQNSIQLEYLVKEMQQCPLG